MPETDKKNLICHTLLFIYIIFLGSLFLNLCQTSSIVDISSIAGFGKGFTNLFKEQSCTFLSLSNMTYSVFMFISDNSLFSHLATSFFLYVSALILVYKTTNLYKDNCIYGLIAVFIFSTFPKILLQVLALNIHISETVLILFVIYFYGKSSEFSSKKYSLLYLIFSFLTFNERPSFILYLGIIVLLTSYTSIKKRNFKSLFYNSLIMLKIISLSTSGSPYLLSKTGHLFLFSPKEFATLPLLLCTEFFAQLLQNISLLYFLILSLGLCVNVFAKQKERKNFFMFIEILTLLVSLAYCLTLVPNVAGNLKSLPSSFEKKYFYDIFPLFAFIAIIIANCIYSLKKYNRYIFLFLLFILPFSGYNFFSYPTSAYLLKPKYTTAGKYFYESLFADIADKIIFKTNFKTHQNFAFVLTKIKNEKEINRLYNITTPKITTKKQTQTLMEHTATIYNLVGFTAQKDKSIGKEKSLTLPANIKVNAKDIQSVLFFSKNNIMDSDNNQLEILNSWAIEINNERFKLYLCGN